MTELIGKFRDFAISRRGEALVTFALKTDLGALEQALKDCEGKDLIVKFGAYSPKRSLNANAYFHVLCREIGKALNVSETFVKNRMIATNGQPELMENGDKWIIKTNLDLNQMWEQETLHVKPLKGDGEVFFYAVMRETKTYTVKEMSELIGGTVEECKALGIPTISDEEMERLLNAWGK